MRKILLLFLIMTCHFAIGQAPRNLEDLVQKYAPILKHDYAEKYFPSSVDWFLDRAALLKKNTSGSSYSGNVYQCALIDPDCRAKLGNEAIIVGDHNKFEDESWNMHRLEEVDPNTKFGNINSAKAYVHIILANHQFYPTFEYDVEIQYWFFYPYNGAQDPLQASAHEGDWEGVSVIVDSQGELKYVTTTEHGGRNFYQKSQLEMEGDHPVLYVARDSHAIYYNQGCHNTHVKGLIRLDCVVSLGDNELHTANKNEIISIDPRIQNHDIEFTEPIWLNYGGRWGDTYAPWYGGSNSPTFVLKDKAEWHGTNRYPNHPDWDYDYTINEGDANNVNLTTLIDKNAISGASKLCPNGNYSFSPSNYVKHPNSIEWTIPSNYLNYTISNERYVNATPKTSSSPTFNITAEAEYSHANGYDTYNSLSKSMNIVNMNASLFSLSVHEMTPLTYTCLTQVRLINNSGIQVSSVNWSTIPTLGHTVADELTVQYSNDSYANINSTSGARGIVRAEVTICDETYTLEIPVNPTCETADSDDGPDREVIGFGFSGGTNFGEVEGQIYPNPTSGAFRIMVEDGVEFSNVRAIISDQSGRTIREVQVPEFKSFLDLDISNEEKGIYIISAFSNDKQIFKGKLVKK